MRVATRCQPGSDLGLGRKVAFFCRRCGQAVGEPLYRGPAGHAPAEVCFECWLEAFERPPWHWPREVLAVWLIANGYTRNEAARLVGFSRRTLSFWLQAVRKDPARTLEILEHLGVGGGGP